MMKWLLLLIPSLAFCQTHEILRPTVDLNAGAVTAIGCTGNNVASNAWPLAYDAAGTSTSNSAAQAGTVNSTRYQTRVFNIWQSTTNTYSSLTLNINSKSNGFNSHNANGVGNASIAYSLNSGTTWTNVRSDTGVGWSQVTDTVTVSAAQNLANIWVGICIEGDTGGGTGFNVGTDDLTVFDIWTDGVYTPSAPPALPTVPSTVSHPSIVSMLFRFLFLSTSIL